jgi:putative transposase
VLNGRVIKQRAYKYRFYPTAEQKQQLARTFGCARFVYNWGLEVKTEAWQQRQESLNYVDLANLLPVLKTEKPFLAEVSSVVLQQTLRNLSVGFTNFFDRRADYPTFKRRDSRQSVRYATNAFTLHGQVLTLAKQTEPLNIVWSRSLPRDAEIVNATVSKDKAERYFVSILVKTDIQPLPKGAGEVGIDVGLTRLATLSNGQKLENPGHLRRQTRRLKIRQRRLSRKVKGSNNRHQARLEVAKVHAKISDARQDHLHQFTSKTINENQVIVVEGLAIAKMMKNHSLAKSIGDAAWGEMFRQLEYKSDWAGRSYVQLDRFFPGSKLCSACGHLLAHLNLSTREWDCPKCTAHHERDENAAKNHLAAGLYLLKTMRSDAAKVTPTRYERRRSG